MKTQEIIAALPKLTRGDLEAVHAVAAHLLDATVTGHNSPMAALVFEAISKALNSPIKLNMMPESLVQRLEKKVPSLILLFNADFNGWDATKNLQIAFLRYMMILLRVDLEYLKLNPSPKIMVDNLSRVGEAFDRAFPNYRASGLGDWIVKKLQKRILLNANESRGKTDRAQAPEKVSG
jgi:hypothetical protein